MLDPAWSFADCAPDHEPSENGVGGAAGWGGEPGWDGGAGGSAGVGYSFEEQIRRAHIVEPSAIVSPVVMHDERPPDERRSQLEI